MRARSDSQAQEERDLRGKVISRHTEGFIGQSSANEVVSFEKVLSSSQTRRERSVRLWHRG